MWILPVASFFSSQTRPRNFTSNKPSISAWLRPEALAGPLFSDRGSRQSRADVHGRPGPWCSMCSMGCDLLVPLFGCQKGSITDYRWWKSESQNKDLKDLDLGTHPEMRRIPCGIRKNSKKKQLKLGKTPFISAFTWHFQFDESIFVGWLVCREFVAASLLFFQLVVPRDCYLVVANLLFQTIQKCSIVDTERLQFACLSADVSVSIRVCVTSTQVSHRTAPVSRCSLADDRIQSEYQSFQIFGWGLIHFDTIRLHQNDSVKHTEKNTIYTTHSLVLWWSFTSIFWGSFPLSAGPLGSRIRCLKRAKWAVAPWKGKSFQSRKCTCHWSNLYIFRCFVRGWLNPCESCGGEAGPWKKPFSTSKLTRKIRKMDEHQTTSQNRLVLGVPQVISCGLAAPFDSMCSPSGCKRNSSNKHGLVLFQRNMVDLFAFLSAKRGSSTSKMFRLQQSTIKQSR